MPPTLASVRGVPETPEQFQARAKGALRMPPIEDWETFPFEGDIRPRALQPPADHEKPRSGEGGTDCYACNKVADDLIWEDEHWQLTAIGPTGLPIVLILEPKEHYDIETLPADLAAEMGPLLQRVERAVRAAGDIGRVHIGRWGEGSEHLHWWFMGRPARMRQLSDSFAAIWDDILPPVPEDVWRASVARVVAALG
jgi:diadenosine tetraphosphate (Ap4A) HIT family hydrolase